ncbi:MAG: hypothetical protein QGM45_11785, partial [Anaerolineales bacterium]|nr:hypothetical protein [Anaerolineales bacterium]
MRLRIGGALVILSGAVLAGMGPRQELYTEVAPHEERPHDPCVPRSSPPPPGVIERCEPVVRGEYVSIQVNVDAHGCNILGDAANEPSIAIDPTDPSKIVIGWRQFDSVESSFRQAGWGYSHDAGHTWVFRGSLTPGVFGSDPVLAADPQGVFFYLSISYDDVRLFRSFESGVDWDPAIQVAAFMVDKPWMTIDRTAGIGRGNIYLRGSYLNLVRSTDLGDTFSDPIDESTPYHPGMSVAADGVLYIAGEGVGDIAVARSSNAQDPNEPIVLDFHIDVELDGRLLRFGGFPNP